MNWFRRIYSATTDQAGRRRRFSRLVPQDADLVTWIERVLPDRFHGCDVHFITPLHHNVGVIDPDTRKFTWES